MNDINDRPSWGLNRGEQSEKCAAYERTEQSKEEEKRAYRRVSKGKESCHGELSCSKNVETV